MASDQKLVLAIVVPCLNEGLTLPTTARALKAKVEALIERNIIDQTSRIYFVDDGSTDNTWAYISDLVDNNECFVGIKLTMSPRHIGRCRRSPLCISRVSPYITINKTY